MSFKHFYLKKSKAEREAYAAAVRSTPGYLAQVAYGHKSIELGLADVLVATGAGHFEMADLPLTERARHQAELRKPAGVAAQTPEATHV